MNSRTNASSMASRSQQLQNKSQRQPQTLQAQQAQQQRAAKEISSSSYPHVSGTAAGTSATAGDGTSAAATAAKGLQQDSRGGGMGAGLLQQAAPSRAKASQPKQQMQVQHIGGGCVPVSKRAAGVDAYNPPRAPDKLQGGDLYPAPHQKSQPTAYIGKQQQYHHQQQYHQQYQPQQQQQQQYHFVQQSRTKHSLPHHHQHGPVPPHQPAKNPSNNQQQHYQHYQQQQQRFDHQWLPQQQGGGRKDQQRDLSSQSTLFDEDPGTALYDRPHLYQQSYQQSYQQHWEDAPSRSVGGRGDPGIHGNYSIGDAAASSVGATAASGAGSPVRRDLWGDDLVVQDKWFHPSSSSPTGSAGGSNRASQINDADELYKLGASSSSKPSNYSLSLDSHSYVVSGTVGRRAVGDLSSERGLSYFTEGSATTDTTGYWLRSDGGDDGSTVLNRAVVRGATHTVTQAQVYDINGGLTGSSTSASKDLLVEPAISTLKGDPMSWDLEYWDFDLDRYNTK